MQINWQLRELNLKIVYYGPALSGKTTNLEQIHARVDPAHRSDLVSLKTHEDRTLFFDFLELELGQISGFTPKIHLYTVPGQSYYEMSRKLVLRAADGVVFVADSSPECMHANKLSWSDMRSHLGSHGLSSEKLPIVLQCNKQDVMCAVDPETMKNMLNLYRIPTVSAVAVRGDGVLDTLKLITRNVLAQLQQQLVYA
jgi:signal recognition particle receptor subunit beta